MSLLVLSAFTLFAPWLLGPFSGRKTEMTPFKVFLQAINVSYCVMLHRFEADRVAPLPETGGAILISNHTCGIDNMLLQAASRRVLRFMIAREFYENGPARPFCLFLGCIPVKRDGTDLAATRAALRTIEHGNVLAIFPEGKITPESGRVIGEGMPGAAFLAIKSARADHSRLYSGHAGDEQCVGGDAYSFQRPRLLRRGNRPERVASSRSSRSENAGTSHGTDDVFHSRLA